MSEDGAGAVNSGIFGKLSLEPNGLSVKKTPKQTRKKKYVSVSW